MYSQNKIIVCMKMRLLTVQAVHTCVHVGSNRALELCCYIRKRRIPSISSKIKRCSNSGGADDHEHASLQSGRAAQAAIYPERLCYAILKGLRKQLIHDGAMYMVQLVLYLRTL